MTEQALSAALEREHQELDAGLGAVVQQLAAGIVDADALNTALTALRRHIYLEEELLFPPLRVGARMMSIFGMIRGHGEIWHTIDALAAAIERGQADELAEGCQRLLTLLAAHNKVEEPVIYPGADHDLTAQQSAQLTDFLETGTMPPGWVCEKAR